MANRTEQAERLIRLRKTLGSLTQKGFADSIGASKATIAGIETGRSQLTSTQLKSIYELYKVDPVYLLTGELPVFRQVKKTYSHKTLESVVEEPKSLYGSKGSPLITIKAQAGYSQGGLPHDNLPVVKIPGLQDDESRVFEVSGDSMEPLLLHGDFIACTRVVNARSLRPGLMYVVVSRGHGVSVKYVRMTLNAIRCTSHAAHFEPFNIDLDDVVELWEVQVRITRNLLGTGIEAHPLNNSSSSRVDRIEKVLNHILEVIETPK